ncbi:hypothetical protein [Halobacteriovorax sp. HLS]|uniref:hypothetical protein n=1 Tax=Halobacteriovorax sp. HLS TaxID=2234000 RepID=UPI000FD9F50F|nr:hypothetical protein [Halobacteriovorax sp. HLS]
MIYFRRLLSLLLLSVLVASCSFGVKDKEASANNSLQLSSFSRVSAQAIVSGQSSLTQEIQDVRFTLKACLKDPTGVRALNAKEVSITGINDKLTTDASGCVTWSEIKTINYGVALNCSEVNRTLTLPQESASINLKYTLDPSNQVFTNLSVAGAKGCQNVNNSALTKNDLDSKLILDEVKMTIKAASTQLKRSDVKYLEYQMEFSSCVYAKATNTPLRDRLLELTFNNREIEDTQIIKVTTNHKGCFKYRKKSRYVQHNYSHWMNSELTVLVKEGPLKEESISTGLLLNPWDNDLVDARFGKAEENPIKQMNKFQIDGVMYILIGNNVDNFTVNKHLNLTIAKTYQIVLNPRIDRGHRFNTPRYERLEQGRFKLKFMLLAPNHAEMEIDSTNFDDFTFITGAEKEVEVVNGTINTLIDLPIKVADLPRMALRTVSIFKLEPIDEEIGLKSSVVTGFFKAKIPWIKTNVMSNEALNTSSKDDASSRYTPESHKATTTKVNSSILDGNINAKDFFDIESLEGVEKSEEDTRKTQFKNYVDYLFENLNFFTDKRAFASKFKPSALEIFASQQAATNENFNHLPVADAQKLLNTKNLENRIIHIAKTFTKTGKLNLLSSGDTKLQRESFKRQLCTLALGKDNITEPGAFIGTRETSDFINCVKNPESYMGIEIKRHVSKIHTVNPKYSNGFNFSVGSRFSIYKGTSESEYTSIRSGIDAAVKIPFGEFFGLGIRLFDVSKGINYNDYENQSFGDDVSESKSIGVEKFVIDVTADYNHCILLKSKAYKNATARRRSHNYGSSYRPNKIKSFKGKDYYVCSRPFKDTMEESWYYLQSFTSGTSYFRDSFGPTEIKLIKVIRGYKNYLKFRDVLRDENKHLLYVDSTGLETPDNKIYHNWKHLVDEEQMNSKGDEESKSEYVDLVIDNVEGSLPGTIE